MGSPRVRHDQTTNITKTIETFILSLVRSLQNLETLRFPAGTFQERRKEGHFLAVVGTSRYFEFQDKRRGKLMVRVQRAKVQSRE